MCDLCNGTPFAIPHNANARTVFRASRTVFRAAAHTHTHSHTRTHTHSHTHTHTHTHIHTQPRSHSHTHIYKNALHNFQNNTQDQSSMCATNTYTHNARVTSHPLTSPCPCRSLQLTHLLLPQAHTNFII